MIMAEPRYIKATDVISILSLFYNYTDVERYDLALAISAVPTADVVERKRGKWISRKNESKHNDWWTCSECQGRFDYRWKFCPNCGADMRKEIV